MTRRAKAVSQPRGIIPGTTIDMGGREWIVPPLTLGQLRRLLPQVQQLTEIGAAMDEAQIGVIVEIITAAVQRNYPDVAPAEVEDLIDLGNAGTVLNAVLTGSGLQPAMGEAAAPATAPAGGSPPGPGPGAEAQSRDGRGSTASSPPPADTAIPPSTR
jgi:hypothetical protein